MKTVIIKTLTEVLGLNFETMSYEERAQARWDYIQQHPTVEHWDYVEYWEHHSKRKSDPELIIFDNVLISTQGRICGCNADLERLEIDHGIRLGNYLGKVVRKKGTKYQLYIHRAVCSTFVPNNAVTIAKGYPDFDCNHKDLDKENNLITNLEWLTHSENARHGVNGCKRKYNKNKVIKIQVDLPGVYYKHIYWVEKLSDCKKLGFSTIALSLVLFNKERHKGCTWQYVKPIAGITYGIPEDALEYILSTKTNMGNAKPVVGTIQVPGEHYGEEFLLIGAEDLRRYGFGQGNVANVCLGNKERAYKCKWRYVEENDIGAYQMGLTPEQSKVLFKN